MKNTINADEVFCIVKNVFEKEIILEYFYDKIPFKVSFPRTRTNSYLKELDEVTLRIQILVEKDQDVN